MRRILIVDDTKTWLVFHKELLTQTYGNEVEIATCDSANEALKVIHDNIEHKFDIILTDLQMEQDHKPLLAGEWLVRNVKMIKEYQNVPIIIISAMNDVEDRAKELKTGCISKVKLANNKLLLSYTLGKYIS